MKHVLRIIAIALTLSAPSFADQVHIDQNLGQKDKWIGAAIGAGAVVLLSAHNAAVPKAVAKGVAYPAKKAFGLWKGKR